MPQGTIQDTRPILCQCPICRSDIPMNQMKWAYCGHGMCIECLPKILAPQGGAFPCPACNQQITTGHFHFIYPDTIQSHMNDQMNTLRSMVQRLLEHQEALEVERNLKASDLNRGFLPRFLEFCTQKLFWVLCFPQRVAKPFTDFTLRITFVIAITFITVLVLGTIYTAYHCNFYNHHVDRVLAAMDTRLYIAGFEQRELFRKYPVPRLFN